MNSDKPAAVSTETGKAAPKPPTDRIYLSVVFPAYNEEKRLPATLTRVMAYLHSRAYPFEVIVADDGSTDDTVALVQEIAEHDAEAHSRAADLPPALRVLTLPHRGKAYAVRKGMLAAEGTIILFSDADLSTPIEDVSKLLPWLEEEGYDVAIGSREGLGAQRIDEPFYRHLMGRVFNLFVRLVTWQKFEDTQCGFKAFRRAAAHDIFSRLRLYGEDAGAVRGAMVTGFDVEALFVAQKMNYRVREVPVTWQHAPGSKVHPVRDTLRMVRDTLTVRLNDIRGAYKS